MQDAKQEPMLPSCSPPYICASPQSNETIHAPISTEPALNDSKYNSIYDDQIRETDLPERVQIANKISLATSSQDIIRAESEWISKKYPNDSPIVPLIPKIISMYTELHYEVPCIHKKLYDQSISLSYDELWKIHALHQEWQVFQEKKKILRSIMHSDSRVSAAFHSAETLDDVINAKYLSSFLSNTLPLYASTKISECAAKFTLSRESFLRNIKEKKMAVFPPIPTQDLFEQYLCNQYQKPEDVQNACLTFCIDDLYNEPEISSMIKSYFMKNAVVSTFPKSNGVKQLNPNHPLYRTKHILSMPLRNLQDDLWIDIQESVKNSYINVTVIAQEQAMEEFITTLKAMYCSINETNFKKLQIVIIEQLYYKFVARFTEDAKDKLKTDAEKYISSQCREKFKALLSLTPVCTKVVGVSVAQGINVAMIDKSGIVKHTDKFETLSKKKQAEYKEASTKIQELAHLYKPLVFAICYDCPEAISIGRKIAQITATDGTIIIPCQPNIYPESVQEGDSLPIKKAIASARFILNPLKYLTQLWNEDITKNYIFKLKLQKNQANIDSTKIYKELETAAVEMVNLLGCEITDSHHIMQFVSGLGIRKALALKDAILKEGITNVESIAAKGLLGKCVLENAIMFLKKQGERQYDSKIEDSLLNLFNDITPIAIKKGQVMEATSYKTVGSIVKCKLSNNLKGKLEADSEIPASATFQCRINSITVGSDHYEIRVSAKPEDISSNLMLIEQLNLGPHFSVEDEDKKIYIPNLIKYVPRCFVHQYFRNVNQSQAIEYLSKKEAGDFIVRPSSKGENYLTLTVKMYNQIYFHVIIKEENRQLNEAVSSSLTINSHKFKGFDDLIKSYAEPIKKYLLMIISHRKFLNTISTVEQLGTKLIEERNKNPEYISYGFAIVPEYPQTVLLGNAPMKGVFFKEYIQVRSQGLFFHSKFFNTPDELIDYFKNGFSTANYQHFLESYNYPVRISTEDEIARDPEPDPYPKLVISTANECKTPNANYTEYHSNDLMQDVAYPSHPISFDGSFTTYKANNEDWGNNNSNGQFNQNKRFEAPGPMTCYRCHKPGHKSYECPESQGDDNGGFRRGRGRRGGRRFNDGGDFSSTQDKSSDWNSFNTVEQKPTSNGGDGWGDSNGGSKPSSDSFGGGWGDGNKSSFNEGGERRGRRGRGRGREGGSDSGTGCRYCHEEGHMIRDCPIIKEKEANSTCTLCNQAGHSMRRCPTNPQNPVRRDRSRETSWDSKHTNGGDKPNEQSNGWGDPTPTTIAADPSTKSNGWGDDSKPEAKATTNEAKPMETTNAEGW